jgi:hypothetical protein
MVPDTGAAEAPSDSIRIIADYKTTTTCIRFKNLYYKGYYTRTHQHTALNSRKEKVI